MKFLIASLGLPMLLIGCTYSPAEFYGIRQAVPEQPAKYSAAPLHTDHAAVASTAH